MQLVFLNFQGKMMTKVFSDKLINYLSFQHSYRNITLTFSIFRIGTKPLVELFRFVPGCSKPKS